MNAYSALFLNRQSFKYRIVSGQHDKPTRIQPDDDILIISKDSLAHNLRVIDGWLKGEEKLYFVIDEAHHVIARSYKKIIDHLQGKNLKLKILGLTATPFRTSEQEKGLIGKIFSDGSYDAKVPTGMAYRTSLNTLIKRSILSTPHCETCDTQIMLGDELGLNAVKSISQFDLIPEDIAEHIAKNAPRNRFIVDTYFGEKGDNYKRYGQTLVFALNKTHAFELHALFNKKGQEYGIEAEVIVSGTSSEFTGFDVSDKNNAGRSRLIRTEKSKS
jgi:superfamily II DNA or RNA helicase